jgi:transcriptional regulator with XRE-family HTH domain
MIRMGNRLRELRKAAKLTLNVAAKEMGTTNQMLGMLERGDRQLTQKWMERIAPVYGVKPTQLLEVATTGYLIPLIGEVQAGAWHTAEVHPDPEFFDIPLPAVFVDTKPFALRVIGPSMNMVYPEGTILICCHLTDLNEEPIAGKRYIIEDVEAGDGIETTVKELVIDPDGRPWAWPRSSHPAHQQPIALDEGRDGHTIQIKARVIYSLKIE